MRLKKPQKIAEGFHLMFDTMILDFNSWSSFVSSAIAYAQKINFYSYNLKQIS